MSSMLRWRNGIGAALFCLVSLAASQSPEESAVPEILRKAAATPPTNKQTIRKVVEAIIGHPVEPPPEWNPVIWKILRNPKQDSWLRARAMWWLAGVQSTSAEKVRTAAIEYLKDENTPLDLRVSAAHSGSSRVVDERFRKVLIQVLVRPNEQEVVQRSCLRALIWNAPVDELVDLVLRRELTEHPHFKIRVYVSTVLAAFDVRKRRALEVLCDLIQDVDPRDKEAMVSQEAWLTFWILSGRHFGVEADKLLYRPEPLSEGVRRSCAELTSGFRPGVSGATVRAVQTILWTQNEKGERVQDVEGLRRIAKKSRKAIPSILAQWRREKRKKR